MKRIILWITVILLPLILFMIMGAATIKEIYTYVALNEKTHATIEDFEIKSDKQHRYKIFICYTFQAKNQLFKNKSYYNKSFLNYFTADNFSNTISKNNFNIWYNKNNPNISSFEKIFPIKNCIYLVLSFIIFIYFLILKYYVYSFQKSD